MSLTKGVEGHACQNILQEHTLITKHYRVVLGTMHSLLHRGFLTKIDAKNGRYSWALSKKGWKAVELYNQEFKKLENQARAEIKKNLGLDADNPGVGDMSSIFYKRYRLKVSQRPTFSKREVMIKGIE